MGFSVKRQGNARISEFKRCLGEFEELIRTEKSRGFGDEDVRMKGLLQGR